MTPAAEGRQAVAPPKKKHPQAPNHRKNLISADHPAPAASQSAATTPTVALEGRCSRKAGGGSTDSESRISDSKVGDPRRERGRLPLGGLHITIAVARALRASVPPTAERTPTVPGNVGSGSWALAWRVGDEERGTAVHERTLPKRKRSRTKTKSTRRHEWRSGPDTKRVVLDADPPPPPPPCENQSTGNDGSDASGCADDGVVGARSGHQVRPGQPHLRRRIEVTP
jgi:hypothetical protein